MALLAYVTLACQVVVAGVFLISVASKVRGRAAYREFTDSLLALGVLPRRLVVPAALGVIAVEAAVAVLVSLPLGTATIGFGVAIGLLTAFTATIMIAMRRGTRVPCRCFGASATPLGLPHVIRNAVLLGGCVAGLLGSTGPFTTGQVLITVGAAAIAILLIVRVDDVVALFGQESAAARAHAR